MKIKLSKDIWGIIFASGVGIVSFLTYKIGKTEGMIQANEEHIDFLNSLIEICEGKQDS